MLFSKVKDTKNKLKFLRNEYKNKINKFIFINLTSSTKKRAFKLQTSYFFYKFNKARAKLIKRCLLTNTSKSINNYYGYSRSIYRKLIQFGIIPGFKKAVW
jgi:ribosomal protein S14